VILLLLCAGLGTMAMALLGWLWYMNTRRPPPRPLKLNRMVPLVMRPNQYPTNELKEHL
jgi:hypothetical protein